MVAVAPRRLLRKAGFRNYGGHKTREASALIYNTIGKHTCRRCRSWYDGRYMNGTAQHTWSQQNCWQKARAQTLRQHAAPRKRGTNKKDKHGKGPTVPLLLPGHDSQQAVFLGNPFVEGA